MHARRHTGRLLSRFRRDFSEEPFSNDCLRCLRELHHSLRRCHLFEFERSPLKVWGVHPKSRPIRIRQKEKRENKGGFRAEDVRHPLVALCRCGRPVRKGHEDEINLGDLETVSGKDSSNAVATVIAESIRNGHGLRSALYNLVKRRLAIAACFRLGYASHRSLLPSSWKCFYLKSRRKSLRMGEPTFMRLCFRCCKFLVLLLISSTSTSAFCRASSAESGHHHGRLFAQL